MFIGPWQIFIFSASAGHTPLFVLSGTAGNEMLVYNAATRYLVGEPFHFPTARPALLPSPEYRARVSSLITAIAALVFEPC
jgi:hypothetical protein